MTLPTRLLALALLLTVAACGSHSASPLPPQVAQSLSTNQRSAFVAGHLYVSAAASEGGTGSIERFALLNGVPAEMPDLTYPKDLGSVFGVDTDGTVYAEEAGSYPYFFHIAVFKPNSNRVSRRIVPHPQPYETYPTSIIGRDGFVYLAFENNDSEKQTLRVGSQSFPCAYFGIAVYAPNARGLAPYLTCFATTYGAVGNALSLGPDGDVYTLAATPSGQPALDVYAIPTTNPTLLHTMLANALAGASGVANDNAGRVYVPAITQQGARRPFVGVYDDTDNGLVKPSRTFSALPAQPWGNAVVDDRYLYVAAPREVLVFDKTARGRTTPIATLLVPKAYAYLPTVAIGP